MNLFNILHNTKSPKVYLYFITLQDGREVFIKIGISGFFDLETEYEGFASYGYRVQECKKISFASQEAAIKTLNRLQNKWSEYQYEPCHEFPEKSCCYDVSLIETMNMKPYLHTIAPVQEIEDTNCKELHETTYNEQFAVARRLQVIDIQVIKLLETLKPSEVAKELNLPAYKISRIKKKYLNGRD